MKQAQDMTQDEKLQAYEELQIYIVSAVESEQSETNEFKLETEMRIDLLLTNIREILGVQCNSLDRPAILD